MSTVFYFLLLFLKFYIVFSAEEENILCDEKFCQRYIKDKGCIDLDEACDVRNKSLGGIIFPAPVPCNCCQVCLQYLNEDDYCTIGSPDTAPPLLACGPGLICTKVENEDFFTCQKMKHTQCFKDQIDFDEKNETNKIGFLMERPKCDDDGNYFPIKCNLNQTCFCVDNDGNRISGEAVYTNLTHLTMKCECSRLNDKFNKLNYFQYPFLTARCLENGSFDQMQCMDTDCWCVKADNGDPTSHIFNVTRTGYSGLPCYNNVIHNNKSYLHDCEYVQEEIITEILESFENGYTIIDLNIPSCEADGWYKPVNEDDVSKRCVSKYGRTIGEYEINKNSAEAANMDCKCARTEYILLKNKIKPLISCCPNGNFKKVQCRDDQDICFCVNDNGLQIEKEVPKNLINTLPCYNDGNYC